MRKLTAALAALVLVALTALPALASSHSTNHTGFWENLGYGVCEKIEDPGGTSFTLEDRPFQRYYTILVVKGGAAQSNQSGLGYVTYVDPEEGVPYDAPVGNNGKVRAISHVIVCTDGIPSEDVEPPPTDPPPTLQGEVGLAFECNERFTILGDGDTGFPVEVFVNGVLVIDSALSSSFSQKIDLEVGDIVVINGFELLPIPEDDGCDEEPPPGGSSSTPTPTTTTTTTFVPAGVRTPPATLPVTGSEAPLLAALGLLMILSGTAILRGGARMRNDGWVWTR